MSMLMMLSGCLLSQAQPAISLVVARSRLLSSVGLGATVTESLVVCLQPRRTKSGKEATKTKHRIRVAAPSCDFAFIDNLPRLRLRDDTYAATPTSWIKRPRTLSESKYASASARA